MRRSLVLLLLLVQPCAQAAEVVATMADDKVGARIDGLQYPTTLPKELTSGLTNRLYLRVTLLDDRTPAEQRVVEVAIRYDLWDEKFSVVSTMNGATLESRTVATVAEIDTLLGALVLPKLFDAAAVPREHELKLRVDVLLNPIGREKLRMIRKWVAQNSTPDVGTDAAVSVTNGLFNRIFEQYADGTDIAASWHETVESRPFRLDNLANEGR